MQNTDYLNMRTTNINIRISPLLKSALIEKGATMGLNLSDFIMHVLTMGISGQKGECQKCLEISEVIEQLESEIRQFEKLADPFLEAFDSGIFLNGQQHFPESKFEILELLVSQFKKQA